MYLTVRQGHYHADSDIKEMIHCIFLRYYCFFCTDLSLWFVLRPILETDNDDIKSYIMNKVMRNRLAGTLAIICFFVYIMGADISLRKMMIE